MAPSKPTPSNRCSNAVALLLSIALTAIACSGEPAAAEKRYAVKGQVRSVEVAERQVVVAHEAIPGYMAAMAMPFRVPDPAVFQMLAPGDVIEATLVVSGSAHQLQDVIVKRKGDAPVVEAAMGPKRGDVVPEVTLLDQDGRRLTTAGLRGKAVVVTFIFTRCPLPEFCPRLGSQFAAIETLLAKDAALHGATRLLSVSFDATFDTPAVLKSWGRTYQPGPDAFTHWQLASGSLAEVRTLASFFGLEFEEESGQFTHNLRTGIIAPDGTVFSVHRGSDWIPEAIVEELRQAVASR